MKAIREKLIKLLGGYTESELRFSSNEKEILDAARAQCEKYEKALGAIYFYVGNYPAWKAQQEFRNLMFSMGKPVDKSASPPGHAENVDQYLGRVVDLFSGFVRDGLMPQESCTSRGWDEDLPVARGDEYLKGCGQLPTEPTRH